MMLIGILNKDPETPNKAALIEAAEEAGEDFDSKATKAAIVEMLSERLKPLPIWKRAERRYYNPGNVHFSNVKFTTNWAEVEEFAVHIAIGATEHGLSEEERLESVSKGIAKFIDLHLTFGEGFFGTFLESIDGPVIGFGLDMLFRAIADNAIKQALERMD